MTSNDANLKTTPEPQKDEFVRRFKAEFLRLIHPDDRPAWGRLADHIGETAFADDPSADPEDAASDEIDAMAEAS